MGTLAERKIKPPEKLEDPAFIRILDRSHEDALWAYVPGVSRRIRDFCDRYDTDTDGDRFAQYFEQNFTAPEPVIVAMIAVRHYHLVGHMVAELQRDRGDRIFCNILQFEIDHHVTIPRERLAEAWKDLEAWAKSRRAEYIALDAINPAMERLFRLFYGFKVKRIRMRKEL